MMCCVLHVMLNYDGTRTAHVSYYILSYYIVSYRIVGCNNTNNVTIAVQPVRCPESRECSAHFAKGSVYAAK